MLESIDPNNPNPVEIEVEIYESRMRLNNWYMDEYNLQSAEIRGKLGRGYQSLSINL